MLTQRLGNIVQLGAGFFILYTSIFTLSSIQKLINASISEDHADYTADGYVIEALSYFTFGVTFIFAPAILSFMGRAAMIVGGVLVGLYPLLFSFEITWVTYVGTIILGIGDSILWVSNSQYLVRNAHEETLRSDISLFWAIFIFSMSTGNILTTVKFSRLAQIDRETRRMICYTATGLSAVGILVIALTRAPSGSLSQTKSFGPVESLRRMFEISQTTNMVVLLVSSVFFGFQQAFGWGIYSSSVGFTRQFGDFATQLAPMTALVFGLGGCLGSFTNMYLQYRMDWCPKRLLVHVGFLIELLCFLGVALNLPNDAVFAPTNDTSLIRPPNTWLALACAFGLGVGDSLLIAQTTALIGLLHPESISEASSAYRLAKNVGTSVYLISSLLVNLRTQMISLSVIGLFCVGCFHWVDARVDKSRVSQ